MAVSAGLYYLTWEKMWIDTAGESMEAEDNKMALVTDTHTPAFDTDDFFDQIDNEVTGTGYTTGGVAFTTTEWSVAAGVATFDAADTVYTTVTISNAEASVGYFLVGSAATDQLLFMQDFTAPASATAANFTVQHSGTGIITIDLVP